MARNAFSNHFLQSFLFSQEPFAVMGERLYTFSKTKGYLNGHDAFHFLGTSYSLDESEEIRELEKDFFMDNNSRIERIMTNYIKVRYIDPSEKIKKQVQQMQNMYSSMQDSTIEKFIMVDVFNKYNHEERAITESQPSNSNPEEPDYKQPSVSDLFSHNNSLTPLLDQLGIICMGGKCYTMYQNGGKGNKLEGYVKFRNQVLDIKPWVPLEELCTMYSKKIIDRINNKAEQHGKQFYSYLEKIKSEKAELDKCIAERKSLAGKTSDARGEIKFRKIKDGEYEISVDVAPYIIEKRGEYYAFKTAKIGTRLKSRDSRIMIMDKPKILNMPYSHPFVWPDAVICFGSLSWERQRGVKLNHWYDISSNRAGTARRIAELMREGKKTLERGYVGNSISPVENIKNCKCKIATNRSDAEAYARSHGIRLERIIKND
jgi:hypothetical protein